VFGNKWHAPCSFPHGDQKSIAIRDLEESMPTLERQRSAMPRRPETVISTSQSGWQQSAACLMRQRQRFMLETECPSFDPSDLSALSLLVWLRGTATGVASSHLPAALGLVLLGAAAIIPEPISRSIFAALGILGCLSVGRLVFRLVMARTSYRWRVAFNPDRRKYTWLAEPIE
jgi:hypothetical protein